MPNTQNIAYCGLNCGQCFKFKKEKCSGCAKNKKAAWCKIRSCCITNGFTCCADCKEFAKPNDCKKFNNIISKVIGFCFNSDRQACIERIKTIGIEKFSAEMQSSKAMALPRRRKK